jgi:hypothetical protein
MDLSTLVMETYYSSAFSTQVRRPQVGRHRQPEEPVLATVDSFVLVGFSLMRMDRIEGMVVDGCGVDWELIVDQSTKNANCWMIEERVTW